MEQSSDGSFDEFPANWIEEPVGCDEVNDDGLKSHQHQRSFCPRCDRPVPLACICSSLPDTPISLKKCHCLVIQHPHEVRRKNRSLPFIELCLHPESLTVIQSRRLLSWKVLGLSGPDHPIWLLYPDPQAISLTEALNRQQQLIANHPTNDDDNLPVRTILLFLDATWKFAKEMHRKNQEEGRYPPNLQLVQLTAQDVADNQQFVPRRFDIRTPPSEGHFSTAECIAQTLSQVEDNATIYETIMKPLDLMVQQWHSHQNQRR